MVVHGECDVAGAGEPVSPGALHIVESRCLVSDEHSGPALSPGMARCSQDPEQVEAQCQLVNRSAVSGIGRRPIGTGS